MQTQIIQASGIHETIAAGAASKAIVAKDGALLPPVTMQVQPGVGGTGLVRYTLSSLSSIKAGSAKWDPVSAEQPVSDNTDIVTSGWVTGYYLEAIDQDCYWAMVASNAC